MSESALKSSYEQQGGTVSGTDEVDTNLGKAATATYTMEGQGQTVRAARSSPSRRTPGPR